MPVLGRLAHWSSVSNDRYEAERARRQCDALPAPQPALQQPQFPAGSLCRRPTVSRDRISSAIPIARDLTPAGTAAGRKLRGKTPARALRLGPLGWKTWLPELDVAPVKELPGCDVVLDVDSAGGTLKVAGAPQRLGAGNVRGPPRR